MSIRTPIESRTRALPAWAVAFSVLVLVVGGVYFAGNVSGENPPIAGASDNGPDVTQQAMAIITSAGCEACHGPGLTGALGPNLHSVAAGPTSENLRALATDNPDTWANIWIAGTDPAVSGIDRKGMPMFGADNAPVPLTDEQIAVVVEYLKSLQ